MERKEKTSQFVIIRKETKKENETKTSGASPQKTEPANLKPENKKRGPFSIVLGKKITIQAAKSSVLYTGELIDYLDGFLILKNAKIFGTKHNVEVDTLIVNRSQIAHVHTEPKNVEEKSSP